MNSKIYSTSIVHFFGIVVIKTPFEYDILSINDIPKY